MKSDPNRVKGAERAYRRMHLHVERMVEGLDDGLLMAELQGTTESICRILQHVLNAESHWLEQVGESRPNFVKRPDLETFLYSWKDLEHRYVDLLGRRGAERTRHPSPLWITLRVTQHGMYHAAQVALMRRLLGNPTVAPGEKPPLTWEAAVDEVTALAIGE